MKHSLFLLLSAVLGVTGAAASKCEKGKCHLRAPLRPSKAFDARDDNAQVIGDGSFDVNFTQRSQFSPYTVNIGLGTPPQLLFTAIDAFSNELWVDPICDYALSPDACCDNGKYFSNMSTTANEVPCSASWQASTPLGGASGCTYIDYLEFSGINLGYLGFGVANQSWGWSAGIMGLGFGYSPPGQLNLIKRIQGAGYIDAMQFSIAMGTSAPYGQTEIEDDNDLGSGELLLSGVNVRKYAGELHKLRTKSVGKDDPRYTVPLTSIGLHDPVSCHGFTTKQAPQNAVFDFTSFFSFLPEAYINVILSVFPDSKWNATIGFYEVSCNERYRNASIEFEIDYVPIRVPIFDFIFELKGSCFLAAVKQPTQSTEVPGAILGSSTLKGAYVVFDLESQDIFIAQYANCGDSIFEWTYVYAHFFNAYDHVNDDSYNLSYLYLNIYKHNKNDNFNNENIVKEHVNIPLFHYFHNQQATPHHDDPPIACSFHKFRCVQHPRRYGEHKNFFGTAASSGALTTGSSNTTATVGPLSTGVSGSNSLPYPPASGGFTWSNASFTGTGTGTGFAPLPTAGTAGTAASMVFNPTNSTLTSVPASTSTPGKSSSAITSNSSSSSFNVSTSDNFSLLSSRSTSEPLPPRHDEKTVTVTMTETTTETETEVETKTELTTVGVMTSTVGVITSTVFMPSPITRPGGCFCPNSTTPSAHGTGSFSSRSSTPTSSHSTLTTRPSASSEQKGTWGLLPSKLPPPSRDCFPTPTVCDPLFITLTSMVTKTETKECKKTKTSLTSTSTRSLDHPSLSSTSSHHQSSMSSTRSDKEGSTLTYKEPIPTFPFPLPTATWTETEHHTISTTPLKHKTMMTETETETETKTFTLSIA
ncbi:aspartic peptidase domain-containing protein [Xylariaceae sp. FL0255]|nr:aspartic peptidase domain-containing protein [Xylariaceae sp. FL0255]